MYWRLTVAALALTLPATARAHFVFLIAETGQVTAVMSEKPETDDSVDLAKLKTMTVTADGGAALKFKPGTGCLTAEMPAATKRVAGTLDYGVVNRGPKPFRLVYHAAGVLDPFAPTPAAPLALAPDMQNGQLRFRVLADGKPQSGVEVTVFLPDGKSAKVSSGADGRTPPFNHGGRYGALAKFVLPQPGEVDGKKYEETRVYATAVFRLGK